MAGKADGIEITPEPEIEDIPAATREPEPTAEYHAVDDQIPQSHDHQENGHGLEHGSHDSGLGQVDLEGPADHWGLDNTENGWDGEGGWNTSHENGDQIQQDVSQLFGANEMHDPFSFVQDREVAQEDPVPHSLQDPEGNGEAQQAVDEGQQRNPFDDIEGGGLFADDYIDTDQRPDPESQGYTLLPGENITVNGAHDHHHPEYPEESFAEPSHDVPAASPSQHSTGFVSAFSQVQPHPSDSVRGPEIVAQEVSESSTSEQIERQVTNESTQKNPSGREWSSSLDAGEEILNFGEVEDDRSFNPLPPEPQQHPFGEDIEGGGFDAPGLTGSNGTLKLFMGG